MKLKSANFWLKFNKNGTEHRHFWLKRHCTSRTQKLLAIHLTRQLKTIELIENNILTKALDHADLAVDGLEKYNARNLVEIIDVIPSTKYPSYEGYAARNILFLHLSLATTDANKLLHQIISSIDYNFHAIKQYKTIFNEEILSHSIFNNQLISLFAPLNNWRPQFHTTNTTELANIIYHDRQWSLCPILADALMDAGCSDEYLLWVLQKKWDLLGKGCWIIDKLLNKR